MPKQSLVAGLGLGVFLAAALTFAQTPTPEETPTPAPTPMLVSTTTPTPSPTPGLNISPSAAGTLGSPLPITPPPATPGSTEPGVVEETRSFEWSEKGAPVFTVDQAVITALKQNPAVTSAVQEIERTKGVIIQIRAEALPQIGPSFSWEWEDPNLRQTTGVPKPIRNFRSDITYDIQVTGTQLVFNYSTFRSIRGTFFQRDSAYFALRNTVDQVISLTKTEFYQVILNRELIVVQEESVRLLESQLKDQENRFEAGTVPRFNVLQAQVQLYNQIPQLITARNNYRISILQLAKTLGLDFNPARGIAAPLRVVGELTYIPRNIELLSDIETAKRNRPFLKEARANVLNQIEQVHVAIGTWLPTVNANGGGEWLSNDFHSSFGDVSKGWLTTTTGSCPIFDSGMAWGRIKQQRALLSQQEITYDDDVRQVELEVQQAASNLLQDRELIKATEKTVEQAEEAVRLAKARLDAGAGTQLDVLNAQVQLTTAQSTRLQALFGYDSALAEYDRVTGTQSSFTEQFNDIAPRATKTRTYYTGSDVDARGRPKRPTGWEPVTTTTTSQRPASK